jgi:glutathione peroxidase
VAATAVPADTPVLHILTLMHSYKGKVLLIINTATGCGFTPHYKPLEEMYKDLKDKGFEILDFPCNQFANQAPGSEEEIHNFCTLKFGTDFPQFANLNNKVFGDKAYIKWNFTKFLINREGKVIARFEPTVDMNEVRRAVEEALG